MNGLSLRSHRLYPLQDNVRQSLRGIFRHHFADPSGKALCAQNPQWLPPPPPLFLFSLFLQGGSRGWWQPGGWEQPARHHIHCLQDLSEHSGQWQGKMESQPSFPLPKLVVGLASPAWRIVLKIPSTLEPNSRSQLYLATKGGRAGLDRESHGVWKGEQRGKLSDPSKTPHWTAGLLPQENVPQRGWGWNSVLRHQ